MVLKVDDTEKSGVVARETECGDQHLKVEDDQSKLGRWTECAVGLNY
jgi:hypothetical protein